jgi:hypothetical protein
LASSSLVCSTMVHVQQLDIRRVQQEWGGHRSSARKTVG